MSNELSRAKILRRKAACEHASLLKERELIPAKLERLARLAQAVGTDAVFAANAGPDAQASKAERALVARQTLQAVQACAFKENDVRLRRSYRGFRIIIPAGTDPAKPVIWLSRTLRYPVDLGELKLRGIVPRLDHVIDGLKDRFDDLRRRISDLRAEQQAIDRELADNVDAYGKTIRACEERLAHIDLELEELKAAG